MTYGLDPSFERWCVALAATRKTFWLRVGRRMDPNELGVSAHKELQKVSLLVAKDHGWPTFELVLQRATSLLHEGSLPAQSLYDLVEILQTDVTALDQDQVIRELVPPVRKQWQQALNRKILHAYANSSPYGSLVQEMEECDRLGEPVADVDAASTELGEDTEQVMSEAPILRRVSTGIGPLDAALRGGWVFGDVVTLCGDSKTGKSLSLSFFGAVGALYGENVGYLALEDQNSTYHARFLAAITGVPIFDLEHPEFRQEARDIWKRLRDKGGVGRVIIDTFQPGSLDPRQVSAWFARKEKEYGIRIRFRIVDYGDLIRSPHKADQESKYTHGETVWRALAAMAMENPDDPNIVLTATQSKRQEFKPGQPIPMLTRKDVADSIHKVRLSHLFLTLTPQPDMSASGGYIWYIDADRRNNATGTVLGPIAHQRWLGRMADLSHLG